MATHHPHNRRSSDCAPDGAHNNAADGSPDHRSDRTASNQVHRQAVRPPASPPHMRMIPAQLTALARPHPAVRDRYWLSRHYVAASTLVTYLITTLSSGSLNARAIEAAGPGGWLFVGAMAALSLLALFEAFVTAFVPGVGCEWLRNRRHTLFMGVALGQMCLSYLVLAHMPDGAWLLLRFLLDAGVAALVAFSDLFARHQVKEYS